MNNELDKVVSYLIQQYFVNSKDIHGNSICKKKSMSRFKKPCTRCNTMVSSTWRPGPCGSSTLCNACGVLYMNRDNRTRMIDLILHENKPIWVTRNNTDYQWKAHTVADMKDDRIEKWQRHEMERQAIHERENKRRKIRAC